MTKKRKPIHLRQGPDHLRLKDPLPRFRTLTICVRGAIYGLGHPWVRDMVARNRYLEMLDALKAERKAAA